MPRESIDRLRSLLCDEYDAEHWAASIVLARRILQREPEDAPTMIRLGQSLSKLFNFDEAENTFRLALTCCVKELRYVIYVNLGHLFRNSCDLITAEEWYRKAIELAPHDASGNVFLGAVYAHSGNLENAEIEFRKGTKCVEGCFEEAYHNLGTALRGLGKFDLAKECYLKALEFDPNFKNAKTALDDVSAALKYQLKP